MEEFPVLNFPSNRLRRDKDWVCKLWQKLCICYTVLEVVNDQNINQDKFHSTTQCMEYCDQVMRKYADKLILVYSDCMPSDLSAEKLCSKGNSQEGLDFYGYEFNQIRSQISMSFIPLWKQITSESNGETQDELLYEFRRKLYNRVRHKKMSNRFKLVWFPPEWLCFLTFALEAQKEATFYSFNFHLKSMILQSSIPETTIIAETSSANDLEIDSNSFRITEFPVINFPYSTLSRAPAKKIERLWQRLCTAMALMEYYRVVRVFSNRSIEKCEYLQNAYRYYAKELIQRYSNEIPKGLTADKLCRCSDIQLEESFGIPFINGQKIYRTWIEISTRVHRFGLPAWRESIVPKYSDNDLKDPEQFSTILVEFRRCWWEKERSEKVCGGMTRKLHQIFDVSWFPKEWLVFLCFGPFARNPYFLVSEGRIADELSSFKNDPISNLSPNSNSNHGKEFNDTSSEVDVFDYSEEKKRKRDSNTEQDLDFDRKEAEKTDLMNKLSAKDGTKKQKLSIKRNDNSFFPELPSSAICSHDELSSKSSPVLIPVSSSMSGEFPPSLVENPAGETGIIPLISQNWTPNVISFQNVQQTNEAEQFLLRMKEMELFNLLSLLNSYNYGNLLNAAHFQSPLPPALVNPFLYTHNPNEMLLLSSLLTNPSLSSSQTPTDNSNQRLLEWISIMESLRASNH